MTNDEIYEQALLDINKVRTEIRREIYIQTFLNTNNSSEDCYDIADAAAWAYIRHTCENNEMYDVIKQALDEMETNTIQYACLAADRSNLAAD